MKNNASKLDIEEISLVNDKNNNKKKCSEASTDDIHKPKKPKRSEPITSPKPIR